MVLGKSCKLVPVMLMNVVLYRRRFAPHKYLVVTLVTLGITLFMWSGKSNSSKKGNAKGNSLIGLLYLLINLLLDGVLNSSQDSVVAKHAVTVHQMMFFMSAFSILITTTLAFLPLPYIPVLHPSDVRTPELFSAWSFLQTYPAAWTALFQWAITGALGQLFIFETLAHFGSLTLVTITLTRKLFTMLLSVVLYNHKLTSGQYVGAIIVFLGISMEAWVKRQGE
jgi:UDP-galactose transporter B1